MFQIRTSKPGQGNKNYIRVSSGGWNTCIKGNPTDKYCDVLANCVGYASGRFNEVYNELTGHTGHKFNRLNCNAENFIERAKEAGLLVGDIPKPGSIIVWQKGATLNSSDGAGHVAFVEKVLDANTIYTSESGYKSSAFWNSTRSNDNGRWGIGKGYTVRGFIYNPAVKDIPITPAVNRDTTKNQLETLEVMNVRTGIETTSPSLGTVPKGTIFNWYECKEGKSSYWYAITEDRSQWIAGTNKNGNKYCEIYNAVIPEPPKPEPIPEPPKPEPTPVPEPPKPTLKVGDKVKIIGTGNGSSYGNSNTAYGIGWTRQILKIYEGRPYPYRVGNKTGTTGFYTAEALQKK